MPDSRVDEKFLFSDIAYGPPGGESHDGDIRPELVFGNQDPWPLRWNVLVALNVDPVYRMETRVTDSSNELIKKVAPADVHGFHTRWCQPLSGMTPLGNSRKLFKPFQSQTNYHKGQAESTNSRGNQERRVLSLKFQSRGSRD